MKTSNLFVDHILVGTVWVIVIFIVIILVALPFPAIDLGSDSISDGFLIAILAVVTYVLGVLFDQFSDRTLKLLISVLRMNKISDEKSGIKIATEVPYHEALQVTVTRSQRAYEYLSYRRSVLRVIRSFFVSTAIASPIIWIIAIIRLVQFDWPEQIAASISFGILLTVAAIFLRIEVISLYAGYYDAIINFYKDLHQERAGCSE